MARRFELSDRWDEAICLVQACSEGRFELRGPAVCLGGWSSRLPDASSGRGGASLAAEGSNLMLFWPIEISATRHCEVFDLSYGVAGGVVRGPRWKKEAMRSSSSLREPGALIERMP